jgi:hypothetical protein
MCVKYFAKAGLDKGVYNMLRELKAQRRSQLRADSSQLTAASTQLAAHSCKQTARSSAATLAKLKLELERERKLAYRDKQTKTQACIATLAHLAKTQTSKATLDASKHTLYTDLTKQDASNHKQR